MDHLRAAWRKAASSSELPDWWATYVGDPAKFEVRDGRVRMWRSVSALLDEGTPQEQVDANIEAMGRIGAWWGSLDTALGYANEDLLTYEAWLPIDKLSHSGGNAGALLAYHTPIEIVAVIRNGHRADTSIRAVGSGGLYWRVHPPERPFSAEDATSKPWYGAGAGKGTQRGYSCFADPWHLWVYLDAAMLYSAAKSQEIIAFSGTPTGETGNDGEDLVVPDMKTVQRMSLPDFERRLLDAPLPSSPKKGGQGRSQYSSWSALKRYLGNEFEAGDDPLVDRILTKTGASWRGLMEGPVWTMAPAAILVDKLGRQSTFECYIEGSVKSRRQTLTEAKAYCEKQLGEALSWSQYKPERQQATHYYYGPTDEFTDPSIAYLGTRIDGSDDDWDG